MAPGRPRKPESEPVMTIWPLPFATMPGSAAPTARMQPVKLMSAIASADLASQSCGPHRPVDAGEEHHSVKTRQVGRRGCHAVGGADVDRQRGGLAGKRGDGSSQRVGLRAERISSAPAAESFRASARPSPSDAPTSQ